MEQQNQVALTKFSFESLENAIMKKDLSKINEIGDVFKNQRMLILSNVPYISSVRNSIMKVASQLNATHENKEGLPFSVATSCSNNMISHMNNFFPFAQPQEITESLGLSVADLPDLLEQIPNPRIPGYDEAVLGFVSNSRTIFATFLRVLDLHMEANGIKVRTSSGSTASLDNSLVGLLNNSLFMDKHRQIKYLPEKHVQESDVSNPNKISVPWHHDIGLGTVLLKECYFRESSESGEVTEIVQPDDGCGLIARTLSGEDLIVRLEDHEVIIQAGMSLQILTNNYYSAQAHCVRVPKDSTIGRLSFSRFFYPPFDQEMDSFEGNYNIHYSDADEAVIPQPIRFSNHFTPKYPFHEMDSNQMMQFSINAFSSRLKKDILETHHVELPFTIAFRSIDTALGKMRAYHFSLITSTMAAAASWYTCYCSEKIPVLFTADQQLQGKGQGTNAQLSPLGNCYATFLFKLPSIAATKPFCLPQLAAISVIEALDEYITDDKARISLKWINDIHVDNKKIGEVQYHAVGEYFQIGIGVNLNADPALPDTTWLKSAAGLENDINVSEFIHKLTLHLTKNLQSFSEDTDFSGILAKINQRISFLQERVNIWDETLSNVLKAGTFKGMDENGYAILENEHGEVEVVKEGRMRLIQAP